MKVVKNNNSIISKIGLLFLAVFITSYSVPKTSVDKVFVINDNSELFLKGSSNVNKFTCDCEDQYPRRCFSMEIEDRGKRVNFSNAYINIRTKKLECGNNRLNKDLYKSLKAEEYPFIKVELIEGVQKNNEIFTDCNGWIEMAAKANITLTDVTRKVDLKVMGRSLENDKFQFMCEKELSMSDFKIDTPKPLLGLIKVHDKITIHFDLTVGLNDY